MRLCGQAQRFRKVREAKIQIQPPDEATASVPGTVPARSDVGGELEGEVQGGVLTFDLQTRAVQEGLREVGRVASR